MLCYLYNSICFLKYQGSIWKVKTSGTNRTEFAPAAIMGSPSGLAFDWITRIMYYTNPTGKTIEVINTPLKIELVN